MKNKNALMHHRYSSVAEIRFEHMFDIMAVILRMKIVVILHSTIDVPFRDGTLSLISFKIKDKDK